MLAEKLTRQVKIGAKLAAIAPHNLSRVVQSGQPVTDPGGSSRIHNVLQLVSGELAVLQLIAEAVAHAEHGAASVVSYALAHAGETLPIQLLRLASPALGTGTLPLVAGRMAEQPKLTIELLEG